MYFFFLLFVRLSVTLNFFFKGICGTTHQWMVRRRRKKNAYTRMRWRRKNKGWNACWKNKRTIAQNSFAELFFFILIVVVSVISFSRFFFPLLFTIVTRRLGVLCCVHVCALVLFFVVVWISLDRKEEKRMKEKKSYTCRCATGFFYDYYSDCHGLCSSAQVFYYEFIRFDHFVRFISSA